MTKVKVTATHQKVAILQKEGYVSRTVAYSRITSDEIMEYAALNSGINPGQLSAAMYAVLQSFQNFLITGHSVQLPIGTFRLSVSSKMVDSKEDVTVDNIYRTRVLFKPSPKLHDLVQKVKFTKVSEPEDDEDEDDNDGGNGTDGGNDSGNGTGTDTGTDTDTGNQGTLYTLTLSSEDDSKGSVDTSVNKQYSPGSRVTIKATPKSGYAFDKWSDGSTVNPRNITLNQDVTLTATFKQATMTPPGEDDDDSPFDGGM